MTGQPPQPPRVLYVDDYEPMCELACDTLQAEGMRATYMLDPEAALAACASEPGGFAVVVVDYHMPRIDGQELTRRLAAAGGPPVIMVSGLVDDTVRSHALAAGASLVMDKARVVGDLAAAIRKLLGLP